VLRLLLDYRRALNDYLERRGRTNPRDDRPGRLGSTAAGIVQETVKQLDLLDVIRQDAKQVAELEAAEAAGVRK
jgi:hypothetical protein